MLQAKTASEYNQTSGASPVLVSELPVFGSDTRDIYNPRLININNGYILGDFGIPATQDGCIIKDSLMWEDLNEDAPKLSAIWAERDHCTFLGGEYIPLYGRWSENFYHWVWENVPAIIMAETAGYRGNYIACSNKYIPQIFEMLGVSINRVFGYRGGSFRVEKLYAPVRPTANS
ncbi:MAG: hypothetical protein EBS53_15450, partial [Bacteroidetes bacterium]|nr:hypothetical protein [Bacteroidota bacterium]